MKTKRHPKTVSEHFDQKYGKKGSPGRETFETRAEIYMIAELIKDARKRSSLTQQELADRLNVKRTYISKIERAMGDIQVSTLRRIIEQGLGGKLHINVEF